MYAVPHDKTYRIQNTHYKQKKNCKLTGGFGEHNKYKPLGVVNYFLI